MELQRYYPYLLRLLVWYHHFRGQYYRLAGPTITVRKVDSALPSLWWKLWYQWSPSTYGAWHVTYTDQNGTRQTGYYGELFAHRLIRRPRLELDLQRKDIILYREDGSICDLDLAVLDDWHLNGLGYDSLAITNLARVLQILGHPCQKITFLHMDGREPTTLPIEGLRLSFLYGDS